MMSSFAQSGFSSKNEPSSTSASMHLVHVVRAPLLDAERCRRIGRAPPAGSTPAAARRRRLATFVGRYERKRRAASIASSSEAHRLSPHPLTVACMRAPPISSSDTCSPITTSAMRGEPRYIEALPSTMNTASQNAGMYAPPAADGPNRQHTCGTLPESRTSLAKIRPAPRRPGNSST